MGGPGPVAYVEDHRSEIVDLALDLLAVDTSNPPGDTREMAALLEEWLPTGSLEVERVAVDPTKPNIVATLPGDRPETLLYLGHLDTVPYDATVWTRDPLGELDGERVYGRGAADMKGALAAMLVALRAYVETDTTPPVTLAFAFVSDEEVGGDAGLPAVLAEDRLAADGCVIGEPTGERDRHSVTVADRGSIWLTLEATGEAAHSSRPMLGVNAIDRVYDAVETIRERFGTRPLDVDPELAPVIDESVSFYEQTMGTDVARGLFETPTINLGTIEGGEAINSVPRRAQAEVDVRVTAGVDTSDILAALRACADDCEGVEIAEATWSVGTAESIDSAIVDAVASTAEAVGGERVYRRSATGGGDAKTLRNAGIPTVEFAFGPDTAHAVDEYTTVEALANNAAVYASLPAAWAERTADQGSR